VVHHALASSTHRPWPLPQRPWALTMDWEDLAFLHWPVAASALQPLLPPGLEVELYDGSAWLGVVPFRMARTRLRWLPPLPTTHAFPELNVRTYVRSGDRAGVWFFSLDACSPLAVAGARALFRLPYFAATMQCERLDGSVVYASGRRDRRAPAATFVARWRSTGSAFRAPAGSLPHFLTERYCLFTASGNGRPRCVEIAHAPWQLSPAAVEIATCDMTRLLGFDLPALPPYVLMAAPQSVVAWTPA